MKTEDYEKAYLVETLSGIVIEFEPYVEAETDAYIQERGRAWIDQAKAAIAKATKGE